MANELVTVIGDDIIVPQYVIDSIKAYKKAEADYKAMEKQLKVELTRAMRENGVDKYTSPDGELTIRYYPESSTSMVAVERMKEDGIYDKYRLEVPKSDYIKISVKKGD